MAPKIGLIGLQSARFLSRSRIVREVLVPKFGHCRNCAFGTPLVGGIFAMGDTSQQLLCYGRVVNALEAVYSDAGLIVCGLSLVQPLLENGTLSLPFPKSQGIWSEQAYLVAFTERSMRRAQTQEFCDWLLREAENTRSQLADFATGSAK